MTFFIRFIIFYFIFIFYYYIIILFLSVFKIKHIHLEEIQYFIT